MFKIFSSLHNNRLLSCYVYYRLMNFILCSQTIQPSLNVAYKPELSLDHFRKRHKRKCSTNVLKHFNCHAVNVC